jgi:hypothetical protein
MSDLQFENEQYGQPTFKSHEILGRSMTPTMVRKLMGMKIAKNERQAGHLLIFIIVICLLVSIYLIINSFFMSKGVPPKFATGEALQQYILSNAH